MPFVDDIEVEAAPSCPSCGTAGQPLYPRLRDHTFGAPGEWAMKRCPVCTLMWLDPRPTVSDIGKVYRTYYTHGVSGAGSTFQAHVRETGLSRRLLRAVTAGVRRVQDAVLAVRFGYHRLAQGPSDRLLAWTLGLLPGMTIEELLRTLGRPGQRRGGGWQGGEVWSWRYATNDCLWFQVSIGDDRIVRDGAFGPDPLCDRDVRTGLPG